MARIALMPDVFDDSDRVFGHTAKVGAASDAPQRINEIIKAVAVLATSPLIRRKVKGGNRDLIVRAARDDIAFSVPACHRYGVRPGRPKPEQGPLPARWMAVANDSARFKLLDAAATPAAVAHRKHRSFIDRMLNKSIAKPVTS